MIPGANLKMIQAIECTYAGRRFRSRREARWAILFDHLGIDWRYEPEGYCLSGNVHYLPDFELHLGSGKRQWVEVKPEVAPYAQLAMLCEESGQTGFLVGEPRLTTPVLPCGADGHWLATAVPATWLQAISGMDFLSCQAAANAALSARWEHGERPRRPTKKGGRPTRAYMRAENFLSERGNSGGAWNVGF